MQGSNRLETAWDYDATIARRERFLSPSLGTMGGYEVPLLLARGEGQYLWDETGRKYLDCMAQNLCISVGYNHPGVNAAVIDQMQTLQHATTMYYNPVPGHFAEELAGHMPAGEDWVVHLVNSGAEAADLAVLMARLFTGNLDIVALRNAYHGTHFGTMSLTGIDQFHHNVPPAAGIHHVEHPCRYRGVFGAGAGPYVDAIDRLIRASTPGRIAGFMVEPIQGYGGVVPMPDGYLAGAAERVRAAGGLMLIDEVQTGFGRTGEHFWGFERDGLVPDIVVMGKGIGNGFPLSAVVARREIAEPMGEKKFFNTYGANLMAAAAGRAVLAAIADEHIQENARDVGARMKAGLEGLREKHDVIGDVRGRGLMLGVEIVADRATKEPAPDTARRIQNAAREAGLIVGRGSANGNVLRVNPPLCLTAQDADFFTGVLDDACAGA